MGKQQFASASASKKQESRANMNRVQKVASQIPPPPHPPHQHNTRFLMSCLLRGDDEVVVCVCCVCDGVCVTQLCDGNTIIPVPVQTETHRIPVRYIFSERNFSERNFQIRFGATGTSHPSPPTNNLTHTLTITLNLRHPIRQK
jgi:hypothetical protein